MDKYDQLMRKFRKLCRIQSRRVLVGWIDGNNTARTAYENLQAGKKNSSPSLPPSNALIARTLNYGRKEGTTATGRHYPEIISRPFMKYAEEGFKKIRSAIYTRCIPLILSGKMSTEEFLKFIGKAYADEVTRAIRDSSKYPPVSEKTLAARRRRGSTSVVPLIDTHQLVDSVSFEVR